MYPVTNPEVVAAAYNGAAAGILSNNRAQPINEPIVTEEQIFEEGVPSTGAMIVATAWAVACDQAFEEIGGWPGESGQAAFLTALSRGVWVNRGNIYPLNLIPSDPEELEEFLESFDPNSNPASDPATYLPVARSMIIPVFLSEEILEELTGVSPAAGTAPPLFTWGADLPAAQPGGGIANGSNGVVGTINFTVPNDQGFQSRRCVAMVTVGLNENGGQDVTAILDINDVMFAASGQNVFQFVPVGTQSGITLIALSTANLEPGVTYTWPIRLTAQGAVGGNINSNAQVGVLVQQVRDFTGPS